MIYDCTYITQIAVMMISDKAIRKIKDDLAKAGFNNIDDEIRNKMNELMDRAKKDFS